MLLAPLALSFMQVASAAPAAPLPDLTLEQSGAFIRYTSEAQPW